MAATNEKIKFELTASDQTSQAFNAILGRLDKVDQSAKRSAASIGSIGASVRGAFAGISVGFLAKEAVQLADSFNEISARLKLVTQGSITFNEVQKQLFDISQQTRVGFGDTVDLYSRMARAAQNVNVSQSDLLKVTDGVNKALIISGANGQSAQAALVQLSQGFASGALRGQELNSVMEQTPRITQAVQKSLGLTEGGLRKLAEEGKLTTEVFVGAFLKALPELNAEFEKMPVTVDQSMTMVKNSILSAVGVIDQATGASGNLSRVFQDLAFIIKGAFNPQTLDVSIAGQLQKIEGEIKAANEKKSFLLNMFPGDSEIAKALQKQKLAVLNAQREILESKKAMRGSRLEYELYGPTVVNPVKQATPLTKEQEAAIKRRQKFMQDLNDKLIEITQGERDLFVVEAKRLGFGNTELQKMLITYDKIEAKKESDKAAKKAEKESKQQLDAAEKSLNYLDKYRQDMDIITEQIALKNDGVYRTAEQQLIENARLQLTKKYNEEIVKIKNLDNLTEQGKLNAIAAANIKYQEQLDLVAQISAQRAADQKDMVKGISTGAGKYFEEVSNLAAFTEDATTRALRGMEDMLVSFVQTGKLSFRDLANSIIADLIRIQMRQMITAPLAGLISGSIGSAFSPITSGTSSLSATSADIMGRRAMGGPVTGGNSYLVGENGPEIFTPGASGGITPNNQISGGGVTVVQTINVTTGVQQTVRAEIMNLMPQIAASAKSAVADAKLRGGSYANALR